MYSVDTKNWVTFFILFIVEYSLNYEFWKFVTVPFILMMIDSQILPVIPPLVATMFSVSLKLSINLFSRTPTSSVGKEPLSWKSVVKYALEN